MFFPCDYRDGIALNSEFITLAKSLPYSYTDELKHSDAILTIGDTILNNQTAEHHFLIQHFRIPRVNQYKLSVLKIMQVAYDVGQLKVVFENESVYDDSVKKFYSDNKLDQIHTYIPEKNRRLSNLNSILASI